MHLDVATHVHIYITISPVYICLCLLLCFVEFVGFVDMIRPIDLELGSGSVKRAPCAVETCGLAGSTVSAD